LKQYISKTKLNVSGKMNPQDAGIVGKRLADAAKILAVCIGISILIYAIRWW